jgi:type I pantothenate kinase
VQPATDPTRPATPHAGYADFDRAAWARLRANTPLTLSESDLVALRGVNEAVSLDEVSDVYLPVSRLLNLSVGATRELHRATATFLGESVDAPFIIGLAGSVAVGKSTIARILQQLLSRWPESPRVDLVTTDGFLLPNAVLESRDMLHRKGFPESYDRRALVRFVADVKAGVPAVSAPVYSHVAYDIVPDREQVVRSPDVLILEGLNVLQTGPALPGHEGMAFVSDYFDFSIYVDADEADVERWYVERFLRLRETVFRDPSSYFRRYADLDHDEAMETGRGIWRDINGRNLRENIAPTRGRARLILEKGPDHAVRRVLLRRI